MEKSKVIEKLFEHIVVYVYLILPLLFILIKEKKRDGAILGIYGLVIALLLFFYWEVPKEHKRLYQTIFTFFEYSFFALIFYNNIKSIKYKRAVIILSASFYIFQIIYFLLSPKGRIDSVPIGVESILIFIYISMFFLENLNNPDGSFIYHHPCFWISAGLLLYLGGSFFIYTLGTTFNEEEFKRYWFINYIADTVKTILFAISFIFIPRKTISAKNQKQTNVPYLDML